jgi:hypothetical protein
MEALAARKRFSGCHKENLCPDCSSTVYEKGANNEYLAIRRATGECETCGIDMAEHMYCRYCGILIGKNHVAEESVDGCCSQCVIYAEQGVKPEFFNKPV